MNTPRSVAPSPAPAAGAESQALLRLPLLTLLAATPVLALAQAAETPKDAPPANAEKTPPIKEEVVELDAFEVKGIRASVTSSLDIKRSNVNMVDAVVAEDVGKFPDNNVVEALQRLPGVQVTDRASAQIATVTIRGLTDVSTTINGRNVFTASGQALSLQDIPASLLSRVDVYKTRSADLIENGIAGQIDIRTHRPFDFKGDKIAFAARGTYADLAEKFSPQGSALFSKRWENAAGAKFGALVNVSYQETSYRNNSITPGAMVPFMGSQPAAGWVPYERIFLTDGRVTENPIWQAGLTNGLPSATGSTLKINGVDTPYVLSRDAIFASDATGKTKRPAANLALQYAPNSDSEYTFEAFYDGYRNENFNNLLFSFVDWWGGPLGAVTLYPGTNIVKSRELVSFPYTFNSGDLSTGRTNSYVLATGAKWTINPDFKLKSDVSYQNSDYKSTFFAMRTDRVAPAVSVDFNHDDGLPSLSFPGSDLTDPSLWNIAQMYDQAYHNKGDAATGTLDGTYDLHMPFLTKLAFGARFDERNASEARFLQEAGWLGVNLGTRPELQYYNSNFFDGKADVPQKWVVANAYYLQSNPDEIRKLYNSTINANLKTSDQIVLNETFNVTETTSSAYLLSHYATFLGGRKLDGQFGARLTSVRTKMNFGASSATAKVTKVLPSASVRYNITQALRLRAGYGETLRRPNFADLNPTITYTKDVTNIGYGTAAGGNPNLKPTESRNYDVALEYFFDDATALFVSGFRREIDGLVVGFRKRVTYQNYDYILSQPDNASNGVLKGVEIGGSYFPKNVPSWLKGIGLQASYTNLHSQQDIPITNDAGQVVGTQTTPFFAVSDHSMSAVLAYERPRFSARLSYQWRGDFLHNYEAALFANPLGIYNRPEQAMELQLEYRVTDKLTVTLDATNLTNEIYQSYYGNQPGNSMTNNFGNNLYSRTISGGMRYSF